MPNVDLLRRTLEHIEAHPEEWDQLHWARKTPCGTAGCFAGTALTLAGQADFIWSGRNYDGLVYADEMASGEDIADAARSLLDLDMNDADALFDPNNQLEDLRTLVTRFTAEPAVEVPA